MNFALNTKSGLIEFTSEQTDTDIRKALDGLDSSFADSLAESFDRWGWSPKQQAWAHYLVWDRAQQAEQKPAGGFGRIVDMFDKAAAAIKYPAIAFELADGQTLRLNRCGEKSRNPGAVNLTNGKKWGDAGYVWFGRIERDGSTRARDAAVLDLLQQMADDPEAAAAEHGRRTGCCCFCRRSLTDDRSVAAGFGPICAERFGLSEQWKTAAAV